MLHYTFIYVQVSVPLLHVINKVVKIEKCFLYFFHNIYLLLNYRNISKIDFFFFFQLLTKISNNLASSNLKLALIIILIFFFYHWHIIHFACEIDTKLIQLK